MVYYFAYGLNMDEEELRRRNFLVKDKFSGILSDYELIFNKIANESAGEGYGNIAPKPLSKVEGIIYKTDKKSIRQLNIHEGYPTHYLKKMMKIKGLEGNEFLCFIYIANSKKTKSELKPTKKYLFHLLKGESYLSKDYFEILKNTETID